MPTARRSVMFLIADDWSPIAGCYGNPVIRTPQMDRLAQRAVVFNQAFCTSPSCAVSRAAILTGHHSHTHGQYGHCHGIHGFRTHRHITSTPFILKQRGYATACIGKKHVSPEAVYPFDFEPGGVTHSPVDLADAASLFLQEHADQPFYLHAGLFDPHRAGKGFTNDRRHRGVKEATYDPAEVIVPDFLPDNDATRADLAEYYQAISRLDACLGALVEALERSGRAEETLVIITSDHGMPFPGAKASSFDGGHRCPLLILAPGHGPLRSEAMVHWVDFFPTIMEWCGIDPDSVHRPVPPEVPPEVPQSYLPEHRPGRSMLPILSQPDPPGWDAVYFSHCFHEITNYYPYRVLRERRYKFVQNLASELPLPLPTDLFRSPTWTAVRERGLTMLGRRPTEHLLHQQPEMLYDLQSDPAETRNLVDEPALQEVAQRMRAQLNRFRLETRDPWLELSWQHGEAVETLEG